MNILVIGNGFDLAHGLQTTYKDFLRFTDEFMIYKTAMENRQELGWENDEDTRFYKYFIDLFNERRIGNSADKIINELDILIKNNVWLNYFKDAQIKNGWIDFESEISNIVKEMDKVKMNNEGVMSKSGLQKMVVFLHFKKNGMPDKIDELKEICLQDLDKLVRCLEIYLSTYISAAQTKETIPDIVTLPIINKVLSFNYTNTYELRYKNHFLLEYDYIHGKANINNDIGTNNMVLGIDEYLKGEERNENIEFIEFKKFYQRIHKKTGCLYRNWIDEIKSNKQATEISRIFCEDGNQKAIESQVKYHKLFIFGHSLDITDKDVLRDLILNDNVQTTIFYMDKKDYGRKIMNLVKIITQDELIKRTGGAAKTITFQKIIETN